MTDPAAGLIALSVAGAILAAWLAPRRPIAAFGTLVVLAALSRATVETPIGSMRIEQPAIAAVAIVLLATGRLGDLLTLPRWARAMGGLLAIYVVVLAISSAVMAPDRAASLRIVAWWLISLAGGAVAIVLVGSRGRSAMVPIGLGGALVAVTGFMAAVGFLVLGPDEALGVQGSDTILPRVYGIAFEANLYASFLAACVPFGLELARSGPGRAGGLAMAALMLLAMPLGVTRAAFVGLAAGLATYLVTVGWRDRRRAVGLAGLAAAVALTTVVGIGLASVLLPNDLERSRPTVDRGAAAPIGSGGAPPTGSASSVVSGAPSQAAASPASSAAPGAPATAPPSQRPAPDTLAFRLERVPVALADLAGSPVIGLGAESFGQRHLDPTSRNAPDHIAILALAVPYKSGVVGSIALIAAFAILVVALWRAARRPGARGPAAAYLASIVTLAVCYQATNALHFAINWLIVGAAVALAARSAQPDGVGAQAS